MRIHEVSITVSGLGDAARFYREVLQLPVDEQADGVTVTVGSSRLVLREGQTFEGVHHLAFGISPHEFDLARAWLKQRVEPIIAGDTDVIDGPDGWDSQSVYFLGPEDIVLELIAREADAGTPGNGLAPRLLAITEVGIGVPATPSALRGLTETLGLPTFPPQEEQFAPVGNHDGLLILVDQKRIWFPTRTHRPARGPLSVHIDAPGHPRDLALTENATITTSSIG